MYGSPLRKDLYRWVLEFHNTVFFRFLYCWIIHLHFYWYMVYVCRLEMTRHVSMISISLSPKEHNKNSPGYSVCFASFMIKVCLVYQLIAIWAIRVQQYSVYFKVIFLFFCRYQAPLHSDLKPQRYLQPQQYQQYQPRQHQVQTGENLSVNWIVLFWSRANLL